MKITSKHTRNETTTKKQKKEGPSQQAERWIFTAKNKNKQTKRKKKNTKRHSNHSSKIRSVEVFDITNKFPESVLALRVIEVPLYYVLYGLCDNTLFKAFPMKLLPARPV